MNALTQIRPADQSLASRMWARLNDCDVALIRAEARADEAAPGSEAEMRAYEVCSDIRREIAGLEAEFRAQFAATFSGVSMVEMLERLS